MGNCCGIQKENQGELLIQKILKSLKMTETPFDDLYIKLSGVSYKDGENYKFIKQLVPIDKIRKYLDEKFYVKEEQKNEFAFIHKALLDKIIDRLDKKKTGSVSIFKVLLRLLIFLNNDLTDKVFFFFGITHHRFKLNEVNGSVQIDTMKEYVQKYLNYNLIQVTNDVISILQGIQAYNSHSEDFKKLVNIVYTENNIYNFMNSKIIFNNRYEELEKIVRTMKVNCSFMDYNDLRTSFLCYHDRVTLLNEIDKVTAMSKGV
jgi:hypothetical protein